MTKFSLVISLISDHLPRRLRLSLPIKHLNRKPTSSLLPSSIQFPNPNRPKPEVSQTLIQMHKSKKGRAGASNTGDRDGTGKRKVSSSSSNPVLNRSPPSVTKRRKRLHSESSREQPQSSIPGPTAEQLRFIRPLRVDPPALPEVSLDRSSSHHSHHSHHSQSQQPSNNRRLERLGTQVEEDEQELEEQQEIQSEPEGEEEEDAEDSGDENHQGVDVFNLNALLATEGRDRYLSKLSPTKGEGLWFTRDDEVKAKCAKIVQEKFDGPYYSWGVVPRHIQDRYFIQFAHRYTWDPIITPIVREKFDEVLGSRVKGMVNYVKTTGKRPNWIEDKLWKIMTKHWATEEFQQKSTNASKARRSDRGGLGVHKHCSGPKSHDRIHQEMEEAEGREVSLGEVFVKTHTRKDGTFVDEKAKKVQASYEQKLNATVTQLDASGTSDAASNTQLLTVSQKNAIFLESTFVDSRGTPYGIGSLSRTHGKGKKSMLPEIKSSAMVELEEKLQDAQLKIEEQSRMNKLMFEYFKRNDPNLALWLEGNGSDQPPQPTSAPQNNLPTESSSTPP